MDLPGVPVVPVDGDAVRPDKAEVGGVPGGGVPGGGGGGGEVRAATSGGGRQGKPLRGTLGKGVFI